jgi:GAF domain-containing protein
VAGYAAAHRRPLLLSPEDDIRQFSGAKTQKAYSAMVVPIFVGEALVGVLNVSQRSGQVNYNEEDLKALQVFAENVGARIRHVEERRILLRRIEMLEKQIPERAPTPAGPQA